MHVLPGVYAVQWLLAALKLKGRECFYFKDFHESFQAVRSILGPRFDLWDERETKVLTPLHNGLISCATKGICDWDGRHSSTFCITLTEREALLIFEKSKEFSLHNHIEFSVKRLLKRYDEITN